MTTSVNYSWAGCTVLIECADTVQPVESDWVVLMGLVDALYKTTPLTEFNVHKISGTNPQEHHYGFILQDGREWSQILRVSNQHPQNNTVMNFAIPDFFSLDEFLPHRALRDYIVKLIAMRGLEKIEIRW